MAQLFPLFIFFASFSIYLFTALPSVYWRDAPEFQTVGFLLDIAHPAGSPLYSLAAKLFTFVPIGSIAFKITLFSALFGAAISVLVYFIIDALLGELALNENEPPSPDLRRWIALFAALVLSFSNALWENSNVTEVYTFQNFFTAVMIFILLTVLRIRIGSEEHGRKAFRLFSLLAFLFGLSLGAHAILVLYLPFLFLAVYFIWLRFTALRRVKTYAVLFFFFLIGFSNYLYLPLRSTQDPYYDWGNPQTFRNLMQHASDRKDSSFHFSVQKNVLPSQMRMYSGFYVENFSVLGVGLGAIGLIFLIRKKQKSVLALFAIFFFPPFLFFIRYWGETSAFIPNFLIYDILVGVGLWAAARFIQRRAPNDYLKKGYIACIWVLVGAQLVFLFSDHFKKNNISDYWTPREVMKTVLNDLPPNAIVFSTLTWFMLSYLQQCEGYRPDVPILSLSSFLAPDFFSKLDQSKFRNIVVPKVPQKRLGSAFLTWNIDIHPIFWETGGEEDLRVDKYLVPNGLLFRLDPNPPEMKEEVVRSYLSNLAREINFDHISDNKEERVLFAEVISGTGSYFMRKGIYRAALSHFELASGLLPNDPNYLNALGAASAHLEQYEKAKQSFLQSISLRPEHYLAYLNLAELYMAQGQSQTAEEYFKEALRRHPRHRRALLALGELSAQKGKRDEAIGYFQDVLQIDPADEEARKQLDLLLGGGGT